MSLLAVFVATIAGLVLEPLPTGGVCFLALTTAVVTKTLSFAEAFSAFTNEARRNAPRSESEARFRARAHLQPNSRHPYLVPCARVLGAGGSLSSLATHVWLWCVLYVWVV